MELIKWVVRHALGDGFPALLNKIKLQQLYSGRVPILARLTHDTQQAPHEGEGIQGTGLDRQQPRLTPLVLTGGVHLRSLHLGTDWTATTGEYCRSLYQIMMTKVQDCSTYSALAMEIPQSCTELVAEYKIVISP